MTAKAISELFERTITEASDDRRMQSLLAGRMPRAELRDFFHHFIVTHLNSVQILSFLHAVMPSSAAAALRENLLEEMGLEGAEKSHPEMLFDLAVGLGFSDSEMGRLRLQAEESKRSFVSTPINGSLKDIGLAMLLETVAFEAFLSRVSEGFARALTQHYGVPTKAVHWFTLHGEVDLRHAEEGREVIQRYVAFYKFEASQVERIAQAAFGKNVILNRYFGPPSAGKAVPAARIRAVEIVPLRIPFQSSFAHAQTTRAYSDAIILRVLGDDGSEGYGEALPRPYVTGEDTQRMLGVLQDRIAPALLEGKFGAGANILQDFDAFRSKLRLPTDGVTTWNATLCCAELALLDWAFRRAGESLSVWLPPLRDSVEYTGVIDASDPQAAGTLAARYADAGFRSLKVKVGIGDDAARLRAVRDASGLNMRIRVDANGAWDASSAIAALRGLVQFGVGAVEQPVAARDVAGLRRVQEESGLPVIADESLLTVEDAQLLIREGACAIFNVRVSKCGGLARSKEICDLAAAAGVQVQVGAQVGETSLLSAAGRHLALSLPQVEYAEGSFGTHLLTEDISRDPVMFGPRGLGHALLESGIGATVDRGVLERYALNVIRVGA